MNQSTFVRRRQKRWRRFEQKLHKASSRKEADSPKSLPQEFRRISQDLNTARALNLDPRLIRQLNSLVLQGRQAVYGVHRFSLRPLLRFWSRDLPRTLRANAKILFLGHCLFYLPALFAFLLVLQNPEKVYDILPLSSVHQMEEMYDPSSETFLHHRGMEEDLNMFAFYISNNLAVAFRTFAGGAAAGIGSLFLLIYNGLTLGAAGAHMTLTGRAETFFPFIIGHSSFELTAIILSGIAGLKIGWRLFVPGSLPRGAALGRAGHSSLPLLGSAVTFLVIAAGIEGFWSALPLPASLKIPVGALGWLGLALYILTAGGHAHD